MWKIRPFTTEDYPGAVAVGNAAFPDYADTLEEYQFTDSHRDPKCRHQRWVAEDSGKIVGVAEYSQESNMYHPRKFSADVIVLSEFEGRGIGSALYQQVIDALQTFDPLSVQTHTREDMARSVRFLQDRGFQEAMRDWESRLDLGTFVPALYAETEAKLREARITIKSYAELSDNPNRDTQIHALVTEINRDVPSPEPRTPVEFEQWVKKTLESPNFLPDGYFVAVKDGRYLGLSTLWNSQAGSDFYVGLTGVTREFRRQGIALALKLRAIAYAKSYGCSVLKTWNEIGNRPMLAINERLGFLKQPAWITYSKVLKEE